MPALTQQLTGPDFERMLADLHAISAAPTLEQIRAVMVRYGIKSPSAKDGTPSNMAATTLRDGPFKRYVERLHAGRETREALCAAAGAGVHPLDAIEEAMVIELQDHLTAPEGGKIDIGFVVGQLVKLRTAISMREDSRRKQLETEAKLREMGQKLQLQQFDAADAVIAHAKEIKLILADNKLDADARRERVRFRLFGEMPKDWRPVTDKGDENT